MILCCRSRFARGKETKDSLHSSRKSEDRESSTKGSPRSSHRGYKTGDPRDKEREKEKYSENSIDFPSDAKFSKEHVELKRRDKLTIDINQGSSQLHHQYVPPIQQDQQLVKQAKMANAPSSRPPMSSAVKSTQNHNHSSHHYTDSPQHTSNHTSPVSPLAPTPVGTGIPKPTAAVKGTSKTVTDKSHPSTQSISNKENQKIMKQNHVISHRKQSLTNSTNNESMTTSSDPKGSLPRQKQLRKREDSLTGISVAMVSPMPVRTKDSSTSISNSSSKGNVTSSESSGSALSEVSEKSANSNSNSSGSSSVIYKPTSSEDEMAKPLKSNIKQDIPPMKMVLSFSFDFIC